MGSYEYWPDFQKGGRCVQIIYVDDEQTALENFKLTMTSLSQIKSLKLFQESQDALEWAKNHTVDIAFLETELPGINGLTLAAKLKEIIEVYRIT